MGYNISSLALHFNELIAEPADDDDAPTPGLSNLSVKAPADKWANEDKEEEVSTFHPREVSVFALGFG